VSKNLVILLGNIGRDPELRHTKGGTAVCELSLAVNERRKSGDQWEDHTEWFRVVVFGKRAETCAQYLTKGSGAYVVGKLTTEQWEKDGVKHYTTKVIANSVDFVGGKRDGGGQHSKSSRGGHCGDDLGYGGGASSGAPEGLDDDIPF
jgi:single-strand DNA-binding protein